MAAIPCLAGALVVFGVAPGYGADRVAQQISPQNDAMAGQLSNALAAISAERSRLLQVAAVQHNEKLSELTKRFEAEMQSVTNLTKRSQLWREYSQGSALEWQRFSDATAAIWHQSSEDSSRLWRAYTDALARLGRDQHAQFAWNWLNDVSSSLMLGKAKLLIKIMMLDETLKQTRASITEQERREIDLYAVALEDMSVSDVIEMIRAGKYAPSNLSDGELEKMLLQSAKEQGIRVRAN